MTPGCKKNWRPEGDYLAPVQRKNQMDLPKIEGEYRALVSRGISEEVCKRYHYQIGVVPMDYPVSDTSSLGKLKGQTVQIENYYDESGDLIAQKVRSKDKKFAVIGRLSTELFGRHCVKAGGKVLVVTEGAIDTMSYAEMRKGWPAVSIPNGAESAAKTLKANVEWLETFEKVVLCFDNDEAGKTAVQACQGILSPGKMFIAALPEEFKDLNEALQEGAVKAALEAVYQAEEYRPEDLVDVDDILEEALKPIQWGYPWFIPELTQMTYGRRLGEVYALGAGTGVGKTDIFTEQIAFDVNELGLHVGCLFLEQKPAETIKRVAGKVGNKRFHVPDGSWKQEELVQAAYKLRGKITFYDSFGQAEWEQVKSRIRHMAMSRDIKVFYLDHLTALADTKDEKGSLEQIMKELAGLANELQVIVHFISHLSTPDGPSHEEGGRVTIKHFKGSRAIGFWSYFMFGMERNQQAEDEALRHTTTFRVLKDRYTGQATGQTFLLGYDKDTGRIILPSALGFHNDENEDDDSF